MSSCHHTENSSLDGMGDEDSDVDAESVATSVQRLRAHGLHVQAGAPPRHSSLRRASILVLISKDGRILLTQRTLHLRSHPGEVCFPGGKQDEADGGDDWTTALRETQEEVGLSKTTLGSQIERLARLRTLESINHLCVTPLVGYFPTMNAEEISQRIQINPKEVNLHFWSPLSFFLSTKPSQEYEIDWQGETFIFRKYLYKDDAALIDLPITGLTAHVAREVAEIALVGSTTNPPSVSMTSNSTEFHGALWRKQEEVTIVTRNRIRNPASSWSQHYYVLSGGTLHQYDNQLAALRKSSTATKKNRLKIANDESAKFVEVDQEETTSCTKSFPFRISILDGRVVWDLAASSAEERSGWKERIWKYIAKPRMDE